MPEGRSKAACGAGRLSNKAEQDCGNRVLRLVRRPQLRPRARARAANYPHYSLHTPLQATNDA